MKIVEKKTGEFDYWARKVIKWGTEVFTMQIDLYVREVSFADVVSSFVRLPGAVGRLARRYKFFFVGIGLAIVWIAGMVECPYPMNDICSGFFLLFGMLACIWTVAFFFLKPQGVSWLRQMLAGYTAVWAIPVIAVARLGWLLVSDWH